MKPEPKTHDHGHGGHPTACEGTVLRNEPQVDWNGKHTYTRLDVKDDRGDLHITVSVKHPLANAQKGAKLTIVQA